ncbi:hypothetical protein GPECTOR_16phG13 [Gonium pectorale]|uniref:Pherophorin domain-containing protein n=1 Tax=Gonium pectorale TaxID=33097 RepID=A0A150GL62_GONPE|nr:hypothetical protein GPECTOR_16phG13 [Gonium pectorale]|eukprot:KXZ50596.1 hypothetical protein GPECTOR_16phG13 [Gonium pectorale]
MHFLYPLVKSLLGCWCRHLSLRAPHAETAPPGALCDGSIVGATFNGAPVRVAIGEPSSKGTTGRRVLAVPNLVLSGSTVGPRGAELCIRWPAGGLCSTPYRATGMIRNAVTISLLSRDSKCCPVRTLKLGKAVPAPSPPSSAAKAACSTCLVWDVVGPGGTANSTDFDFLGDRDCALADIPPDSPAKLATCCEHLAYHKARKLREYVADGTILSGFDLPVCNRTTARLCGTLSSPSGGRQLAAAMKAVGLEALVRKDLGNTDDAVGEGVEGMRCQSQPGSTPFRVAPYLELFRGSQTTLYCISIDVSSAAGVQPQSKCGRSTAIGRVAFWLYDTYRTDILGAQQMTLSGRYYASQPVNVTWGPDGGNSLYIHLSGWDMTFVRASEPKICVAMPRDKPIWKDSMDSRGYLWAALYDESGQCCPTYYANRY